MAGFTASPEYKALLSEYKTNANKIIKEQNEYAARPEGAGISQAAAAPAIPSAVPNAALATQYGYGANTVMPTIEVPGKKAAAPPPVNVDAEAAKRAAAIKAAREAAKK
jgi:hypothetical protein